MAHSTTIQLVDSTSLPKLIQEDKTTIVEFGADWCPSCVASLPIMEQLQIELPEHNWVRVDIDASPDLLKEFKIKGAPTFISFQEGKQHKIHIGKATKAQLIQLSK